MLKRNRLPDIPPAAPEPTVPVMKGMSVRGGATLLGDGPSRSLAEALPALPDETVHLISRGQWSLHNMLAHVAGLTGPAACFLTSWGISAKPMQSVLDLVRNGAITELRALFDHRVRLQCAEAFQLLLAVAGMPQVDVRLTKIHAKVATLVSATHAVTIGTSANLTTNPRIETYWVCATPHLAHDYNERLGEVHATATPLT